MRPPRQLRPGEEATLGEHLTELRSRLFVMVGALAAASALAYVFHARLIHWLNAPLPHGMKPVTLGVAEPFMTSLKISLWAGLILASPVLLWQLWSFLAPAVDERSQRLVLGFVLFATGLLGCGIVFGYFLALPAAIHFLTGFDNSLYNVQVQAKYYYSFAVTVLVAVGVVFELPIFVIALVRLRVLSTDQLRRNRRIGYFSVACIAVALPGVDPVTTIIEGIPLAILYELSIWLAVALDRRLSVAGLPQAASQVQ